MQLCWCYDIWLSRYSGRPCAPLTRNVFLRDDVIRHCDVTFHPIAFRRYHFYNSTMFTFRDRKGGRITPRTFRAFSEPGPNRVKKEYSRVSIKQGRGDIVKRNLHSSAFPVRFKERGSILLKKKPIFSLNR